MVDFGRSWRHTPRGCAWCFEPHAQLFPALNTTTLRFGWQALYLMLRYCYYP